MTNEELNCAANNLEVSIKVNAPRDFAAVPISYCEILLQAARELLQLKDGTHTDMVMVPREVVNFLNGTGELEGVCFGEKNGYHNGNFWWRKYLGAA